MSRKDRALVLASARNNTPEVEFKLDPNYAKKIAVAVAHATELGIRLEDALIGGCPPESGLVTRVMTSVQSELPFVHICAFR